MEKLIDQSSLRFESEKRKRQRRSSSRPPSASRSPWSVIFFLLGLSTDKTDQSPGLKQT